MMTLILISVAIFLFALGGGVGIWFVFHTRRLAQGAKTEKAARLPFRWRYIILPVTILLLSIILAAAFYHQLPTEVAYHFKLDGSPDRWLSREVIMAWVLLPQLCLALLAGAIVRGVIKLGILSQQNKGNLRPEGLLSLVGNIVGLPQFIICFAMLDIFSYNSYQTHIMPLWLFILTIMGLGGIILGVFFILLIRRAWGLANIKPGKSLRSDNRD